MQKLVAGLHKFQSEIFGNNKDLFTTLSAGQHPEGLFITCSDSRITPSLLTQTNPGDLFILRNAGNLVPPYNDGHGAEAATIEFAVAGLGVKHIIVCGHTHCGAVKGLLHPETLKNMPAVKAWLGNAEATRRVIEENYGDLSGDAKLTAATEENVLAQVENLRTHPAVRSAIARGAISLYAWVYKIQTGEVFQFEHERGQFALITAEGMKAVPANTRYRGIAGDGAVPEVSI